VVVRDRQQLIAARSNMGATVAVANAMPVEKADEIVCYVIDFLGISTELGYGVGETPIRETPFRKALLAPFRDPPEVHVP
jgi:hypothetical protein